MAGRVQLTAISAWGAEEGFSVGSNTLSATIDIIIIAIAIAIAIAAVGIIHPYAQMCTGR
jgi:hypothetical protein